MSDEPFFRQLAPQRFAATLSTRGPWSDDHQHAGPPSALLVRALEALAPQLALSRITLEMLRPIPIGTVDVEASLDKAGKKVALARARLLVDGACLIDARAVLVRPLETPPLHDDDVAIDPAGLPPMHFTFFRSDVGYHTAMEGRAWSGTFGSGKMAVFLRQRVPLVDDEEPSGAQRALVAADAGSGVSAGLDLRRFTFLNADLSVHLLRAPRGPWVLLDATTVSAGNGRALATTRLGDARGPIGHALQTLVVEAVKPSA